MTSLVVQTSFLGDVILVTPLIAELARRGPVDVLTTPQGAAILANNPDIRNVIPYDKRGVDSGLPGFARTVSRIRQAALPTTTGTGDFYSDAYMAQGSVRSALLVTAARIPNRIGFDTSQGRNLYTKRVTYRADRHHAERLWWLSMEECADQPEPQQIVPRLYPSDTDCAAVDALLAQHSLNSSRRFVVLAPGSVWGTKRWPFYPELAARIAPFANVVVAGSADDSAAGDAILAQLPSGSGLNAAGRLGLLAAAELIRRGAVLVGNDSAPQHLASAMGTPTVTIFGPTVPEFGFGPLAPRSVAAGHSGLACRPCHRHGPQRCPLGHWRCMRELSSGEVFDLIATILG